MKLDIQKLKQAAQKATQGQWIVESQDCRWNVTDAEGVQVALAQQRTATRDDPKQADRTANAEFIALANPENVQVLISQRDELLTALEKYEQAFGEMFAQCCSNPVYDAWGKPVEALNTLSEAHFIAGKAITHIKGGAE